VPGGFPKNLQELRPSAAYRHPSARIKGFSARACLVKTGLRAALILCCLSLGSVAGIGADSTTALPSAAGTPPPPVVSSAHLTDAQDRLGSGELGAVAEKRSRANALYAEAMLLPGDSGDDQAKALDLFRQVVALDPSFADAQVKLANLLLQSGQLDSAETQLKAAIDANPDSLAIQAALGFTERLRGQNDEAQRLSTRVLTHDPTQLLSMQVLLEIAGDEGDLAGGVIHIEDILKNQGDAVPADAWLNLARLYMEVARSDVHSPAADVILKTRLPMLQHAAAASPPNVEALTMLADTYRDLGRKTEALQTFQLAAASDPSDVNLLLHCADLEADLELKTDALRDYQEVYRLNPELAGLREMLGGLYLEADRYADAVPLFEEALATAPQNSLLNIDLGIAYSGSHRAAQAEAAFRRVFDLPACPPEAYLKLALFQLEHDQIKQAARTLTAAQAHFPSSTRVRYFQAIRYRYQKNYAAALACLAEVRALATGPESDALDPAYYLESSLTLSLAGRNDQVEPTLREALAKYPDNPEIMNELAYFWADQGSHLSGALELSQRAAALDPESGPIQDTWGWVYYQMGQAKDALPYLQRAAVMTDNDPVVLQHIGDAYLKLGLTREAISTWTRALRKDPGNGALAKRINAALAQAKNAHLRSAPGH
jgi:tetratricopeptide (TPR) repeat protein